MSRLGPAERLEFQALRALCYAGLDSVELRERIAHRLRDALRLDAFCLMELEPTIPLPVHTVTSGWTVEAQRLLIDRVLFASPVADLPRLARDARRTIAADEIATDTRRDPYFAYHLLPFGYRHDLLSMCRAAGRPRALLTFTRAAGRGAFDPAQVRLVDAIAPHVAAGIQAAGLRAVALADATARTGVIALDADGRIDFANGAAEDWLRRRGDGSDRWWMALQIVVALAGEDVPDDRGGRVPVLETRDVESGVLYRLQAERALDASGRPRTLILIEPVRVADRPAILVQLGLTDREADVAVEILRGSPVDEIARALGIAPPTVRVHIHNIFDKLGVTSRQELGARLLGGGWVRRT